MWTLTIYARINASLEVERWHIIVSEMKATKIQPIRLIEVMTSCYIILSKKLLFSWKCFYNFDFFFSSTFYRAWCMRMQFSRLSKSGKREKLTSENWIKNAFFKSTCICWKYPFFQIPILFNFEIVGAFSHVITCSLCKVNSL